MRPNNNNVIYNEHSVEEISNRRRGKMLNKQEVVCGLSKVTLPMTLNDNQPKSSLFLNIGSSFIFLDLVNLQI